jgi:hypothetical protein
MAFMKKLIALMTFLVACGSASPKVAQTPKQETPSPFLNGNPKLYVKGDGWSITFPSVNWIKMRDGLAVGSLYLNKEKRNSVLIMKVQVPNETTTEQYIVAINRKLALEGASIGVGEKVELNNFFFVRQTIMRDNSKMWAWVNVRNGVVSILLCGGLNDMVNDNLCQEIAETFKIGSN